MSDIWNKDPETWRKKSLVERLEAMRKWYCTGSCGQSSSLIGTASALNATLLEAEKVLSTMRTEE